MMALKYVTIFLIGINVYISIASKWCKDGTHRVLECNYFPKDIPQGILEVRIYNFMDKYDNVVVNSSTFPSENWSQVKRLKMSDSRNNETSKLKFEANCFSGLKTLQEFHLHAQVDIDLNSHALVGLNNLKTLDLSECGRLSLRQVNSAINGSTDLKLLEVVNISRLRYHVGALDIDMSFFDPLQSTSVKLIDISHTDISIIRFFDLQYLKTLEVFNLSSSSIADMSFTKGPKFILRHVKTLDISYFPLPKLAALVPKIITNLDFFKLDLPDTLYDMKQLLSCKTINVTGILRVSGKTVKLKNYTLTVTGRIPWLIQEIVGRQNNLNRLDAHFHCENYTAYMIKRFDVAENNLEFLHPSIVACFPNLEILDLSDNLLFKMAEENVSLFEQLFISLRHLKSINLSANRLRFIPRNLFENNLELVSVYLSFNFISQVTFTVYKLSHLEDLDLKDNEIKILDSQSMAVLDSIRVDRNQTNAIVNLDNNQICCCTCGAEPFLKWLSKTNVVDRSNLRCVDENFISLNFTENGLQHVRNICKQIKIRTVSLASTGAVTLVAVITFTIFYRRRKQKLKMQKREKVFWQLRNGNGSFKFAAFLHYSSEDEEFVQNDVENELNNKLKEIIKLTDLERELLCSERNARPGHSLLNEISDYVISSSVFIVVLSEAYCSSSYCRYYLESINTSLSKPVIFLMKQQINERHMKAPVRLVYKQATVKIHWEIDNKEHVVDQLCSSIVDLIVDNFSVLLNEHHLQRSI